MRRGPVLSLGARELGAGAPAFVLASAGSAHGGSAERALRMIEAAFKMGADGILFAMFRSSELVVRRHPERRLLESLELSAGEARKVLGAARASGLGVVVEALDAPSLALAVEAEADGLQLHPADLENPELLRAFAEAQRPVLVATGDAEESRVREALDLLPGVGVLLLHGPAAAPAPPEELRLRELRPLKERHGVPVGLLDSTDGGSAFALMAPALAVSLGADLVEKRFTLDRSQKGHDYEGAVSPEDFYRMVELLRQAERAAGDGHREERSGLRGLARSIVAGGLIKRGEVLTAPMLAYKRTTERTQPGLPPREAHRVIGRRAARPIEADEPIREDMLE
jgi:N,N'-diacetyllegionaminate synthase